MVGTIWVMRRFVHGWNGLVRRRPFVIVGKLAKRTFSPLGYNWNEDYRKSESADVARTDSALNRFPKAVSRTFIDF